MSERQQYEKQEKGLQKREEKGSEKNWNEKWRRDPLNAASWAIVIMWAGLVLLADNLGLLARFEGLSTGGLVLIGVGLIRLLAVLIRFVRPDLQRTVTGDIVFSVVMLGVGLSMTARLDWRIIWAVALIAAGLVVLLQGLLRRR